MNVTVDHIIHTTCQELSSQHVEKFRLNDLVKCAGLSKNTIYYYFDSLEDIYKEIFEKIILESIMHKSTTFNETVENFVTFIANNKVLCLNLYNLTLPLADKWQYLDKILNQNLPKYHIRNVSTNFHIVTGLTNILQRWFEENLQTEVGTIIFEVQTYNQAVQKAWI